MTILNTGNVGIGTTSPLAPLSVSNSAATTLKLSMPGTNETFAVASSGNIRTLGMAGWSGTFALVGSTVYVTNGLIVNVTTP